MGKITSLSRNRVIEILRSNGFRNVRSKKHITFKKVFSDGTVLTTWVPHHCIVTAFVIHYIIKQTGKPREEFES